MKIVFDDESQKEAMLKCCCPSYFISELSRRCDKECYLRNDLGAITTISKCAKCFEKFDDFIQLEVKDEQSR